MLYPKVYNDTIQEIKSGMYGEVIRAFMKNNPDGAVDCSNIITKCIKCNKLEHKKALTMYLPKQGYKKRNRGIWSVSMPFIGVNFVDTDELKEYYNEYAQYEHRCIECGAKVEKITEDDFLKEKIKCPQCGGVFEYRGVIWFD